MAGSPSPCSRPPSVVTDEPTSAALSALPHIANVAALGGGIGVAVPSRVEGLVDGWVAYRAGSLRMSVGIHWCNNVSGLVLCGIKDDVLKTVAPIQFELLGRWVSSLTIVAQALMAVSIVNLPQRRRLHSLAQAQATERAVVGPRLPE